MKKGDDWFIFESCGDGFLIMGTSGIGSLNDVPSIRAPAALRLIVPEPTNHPITRAIVIIPHPAPIAVFVVLVKVQHLRGKGTTTSEATRRKPHLTVISFEIQYIKIRSKNKRVFLRVMFIVCLFASRDFGVPVSSHPAIQTVQSVDGTHNDQGNDSPQQAIQQLTFVLGLFTNKVPTTEIGYAI
jgi:hypothetical protein